MSDPNPWKDCPDCKDLPADAPACDRCGHLYDDTLGLCTCYPPDDETEGA